MGSKDKLRLESSATFYALLLNIHNVRTTFQLESILKYVSGRDVISMDRGRRLHEAGSVNWSIAGSHHWPSPYRCAIEPASIDVR